MKKIRVAVMFGGQSFEHDISILTALQAMPAVRAAGMEPVPLYCSLDGVWFGGSCLEKEATYRLNRVKTLATRLELAATDGSVVAIRRLFWQLARRQLVADVILPCFHGAPGESGALLGPFEAAGVPVATSGTVALALAINKAAAKSMAAAAGVPVLFGVTIQRNGSRLGLDQLSYPLIVKPLSLGSSIGISLATNRCELDRALDMVFRLDSSALVEPALDNFREINCSVARFINGPVASVCEEVFPGSGFLSFADKYQGGAKAAGGSKGCKPAAKTGKSGGMAACGREVPARLEDDLGERIRSLAITAFESLGCEGVVRVDFLIDKSGRPWFNELNAIPGSLAWYLWEASGVTFAQLVRGLIERAAVRAQAAATLKIEAPKIF